MEARAGDGNVSSYTNYTIGEWDGVGGMIALTMEELFPTATKIDFLRAKHQLSQYVKMKKALEDFEKHPPETAKQFENKAKWERTIRNLDRAVNQIKHHDVRALIEYRFIKGNSRAATILRFSSWDFCEKTFDRKIDEGVASIAGTLLYLD